MSKKHVLIFAAAIVGSHYAQAQKDTTAKQLDEVVVTANKFPQKESSTGKVLTVISREQLERSSGRTIAQVLAEQAGITVVGSQNALGTNQDVYMRGAGSPNTLILVDGMPANDASDLSAVFDINHFSIDQVERIEILKGAQSVLYGSDAVAGVINIITRKQGSNKLIGLNGGAAGGSYGTFKGNAGLSGKVSLFSYNFQYSHLKSDGFSTAYDTTGNQHFDNDGYRQDEMGLNITAQATKDWKLRLFGSWSRYKTDLDATAFTDDKTSTLRSKNMQAGIASVTQFGKSSLNVNLDINNTERNLADASSFGNYNGKSAFAEAFTNVYLAEHLALLAGVDYREQKASINSTYDVLGADSLHSDQESGYASFMLQSLRGFSAELGGRYTHHSAFGDAFTWSFNPSYLVNRQVKIFANIASGFRAPSLYNLASEYGNKNLQPEKSMSYEGGLQYFDKNNTVNLRATFFFRDITDVIIFNSLPVAPYGQYGNANKQKDQGFELEATVHPAAQWTVSANYSYVDGKLHSTVGGKDTGVFNLYRRPKNTLNATVGFQPAKKLYASLGLHAVSKRQDLYFDPVTYATDNVTLASYYTLNAYAAYQVQSHLKLFVDFQNITNQQYFDIYGYNSRRFNFMAGVSVNF